MTTRNKRCIVIDASVAQAAGGEAATHSIARYCRDFLVAVKEVCHSVVMTADIYDEWRGHQSRFAQIWMRSMFARRKVCRPDAVSNASLRSKLGGIAPTRVHREAMLKDFHLIEAAMATDSTVASRDETARQLFKSASRRVGEIRGVAWVNPERLEEEPISWLEDGAMLDRERQLGS